MFLLFVEPVEAGEVDFGQLVSVRYSVGGIQIGHYLVDVALQDGVPGSDSEMAAEQGDAPSAEE